MKHRISIENVPVTFNQAFNVMTWRAAKLAEKIRKQGGTANFTIKAVHPMILEKQGLKS